MFKILKKYFIILIFPICLIMGLIRQGQIQTSESAIHRPTMTGAFTCYSYIFIGICLTIITLIVRAIYHGKLRKNTKITLISTVLIIGLPLVCSLLLIFP